MSLEPDKSVQFACTLTGSELRERGAKFKATLLPHIQECSRLRDGLRLIFPSEIREKVEAFVELERQCCGFLTFSIDEADRAVSLTIQAPPEATSTLEAILAETASVLPLRCGCGIARADGST